MKTARREQLLSSFEQLGSDVTVIDEPHGELALIVPAERLIELCTKLRDDDAFRFEMLMDVAGVDYMGYGVDEWRGASAIATVDRLAPGRLSCAIGTGYTARIVLI